MPSFRWDKILQRWNEAILESVDPSLLPPEAIHRHWVGCPPATDAQIEAVEQQFCCRLPRSYREFLKVTNGWPFVNDCVRRLWPVQSLRLLSESQNSLVEAYSKVPELEPARRGEYSVLPSSHYAHVIQISDYDDGCFLLNPHVQTTSDECQACFFADWVSGAECYPSFKDLILSQYESFIAAHQAKSNNGHARHLHRNLRKPPKQTTTDPVEFLAELERLGFFRYCSPENAAQIRHQFLNLATAAQKSDARSDYERLITPGAALFPATSGRVANVDSEELIHGGAPYALSRLRPLLAATGIELAPVEELRTTDVYAARLEGVEQEFFKLKDGHPDREAGEVPLNAARFFLYETAKLVTRTLRSAAAPSASLRWKNPINPAPSPASPSFCSTMNSPT